MHRAYHIVLVQEIWFNSTQPVDLCFDKTLSLQLENAGQIIHCLVVLRHMGGHVRGLNFFAFRKACGIFHHELKVRLLIAELILALRIFQNLLILILPSGRRQTEPRLLSDLQPCLFTSLSGFSTQMPYKVGPNWVDHMLLQIWFSSLYPDLSKWQHLPCCKREKYQGFCFFFLFCSLYLLSPVGY